MHTSFVFMVAMSGLHDEKQQTSTNCIEELTASAAPETGAKDVYSDDRGS